MEEPSEFPIKNYNGEDEEQTSKSDSTSEENDNNEDQDHTQNAESDSTSEESDYNEDPDQDQTQTAESDSTSEESDSDDDQDQISAAFDWTSEKESEIDVRNDRIVTGSFEQEYCCFPISQVNKSHLEDGNRILMPVSALDRLMSINIEYPMLFEIKNPYSGQVSHCGVLEFSADEGLVFLPEWMMKNMQLQEGQLVSLKSVSLPKATYMKIQPHTMKFMRLSDPKTVLEATLKDFSCLTIGDTIRVTHEHNQYYIDILETKPSGAISVVETDCEVDFAPPLDYKEPEKKPKAVSNPKREGDEPDQEETGKEEPKFRPFTGVSRRLDGQPSTASAELGSITTTTLKEDVPVAADGTKIASDSRKRSGKVVFGSEDASQSQRKSSVVSQDDLKESSMKSEQQKFQPFTGKKHTLGR